MSARATVAAAGTLTIGGDLAVNRLGYGAMRLAGRPGIWGEPDDRAGAQAVLRRAVELGVTFVDTAQAYGPETNERLIGDTLAPFPEGLVVATKGGLSRSGPNDWSPDGRPETLRAQCDGSLRRLCVERIDLYQLHTPDPRVPLEDSVGELAALRSEGKIRHVGVSNVTVEELARARAIVDVVSVQNRYSLLDRSSEDVLAECERDGLAFIPWFPLGAGSLARASALDRVASPRGATRAQVALAWLLHRSRAMLPIPGTSSVEHLEENLAAAGLELTAEDVEALGR